MWYCLPLCHRMYSIVTLSPFIIDFHGIFLQESMSTLNFTDVKE